LVCSVLLSFCGHLILQQQQSSLNHQLHTKA
jgi:hypothetical protein